MKKNATFGQMLNWIDLAVAPRAVLGWALGWSDGLGPLEAVALAAAAPCSSSQ